MITETNKQIPAKITKPILTSSGNDDFWMKKANAIEITRAASATISFGENSIVLTPFKKHYNKSAVLVTVIWKFCLAGQSWYNKTINEG